MKVKKIISLLAGAAILASLTGGCNSKDESQSAVGGAQQKKVENILEKKLDNYNVRLDLYWELERNVNGQGELADVIKEYEEKTGGKVSVRVIGYGKGISTLTTGLASGDISDLMFIEGSSCFPSYAINEYIQPIDKYIDGSKSYTDQVSLDSFKFLDKHYAFTNKYITQPYIIAYLKSSFKKEGLETPVQLFEKGQWTYDKFVEYARYFTRDTNGDGAIDKYGLGARSKYQSFTYANDGYSLVENSDGTLKVTMGSEKNLEALNFLNVFGKVEPNPQGWLGGDAVMFNEVFYNVVPPKKDEQQELDFDFVPMPTKDGRLATTPVWDNGYAIPEGAPNPDAAAIFATMICKHREETFNAKLSESYTPEIKTRYEKMMATIIPQMRTYPGIDAAVGLEEAFKGTPAATVIETYKSKLEEQVNVYNSTYIKKK